ncbi:MAG: peptidylprolyl isomerase [Candidatus Limnocylindrales bacterium]|jgi:cyclophilin family peptidyl-prolyl cis-trans isomerase
MTLATISSSPRRLATIGLVAWLVAACAVPTNAPTDSPTPEPTIPPTAPAYTLGPTPSACPTSAPAAMAAGTTATVTMTTNYGTIVIKVEANLGPNAAGAFIALARCGYYNNVVFHRVVPNFVIQAGDGEYARLPNLDPDKYGQGGPGWTIPDDKVTTSYKQGTVAMANTGAANSGSSQFFIVLTDSAFDGVAATYSIFGNVTSGMDVVDKIAQIPLGGEPASATDQPDIPLLPAVITSTIVTTP